MSIVTARCRSWSPGQIFLAIAALVQIFFEPASPVWLVLVGLGLFGFGWGLQQATSALAATSAFPPASASLIIGVLYSIWNFGSSVGLAIGGLIFEELDRRSLASALAHNITLAGKDQDLVRSLLSDPSQALQVLGTLTPGLEAGFCRSSRTPSWPAIAAPCRTCSSPARSAPSWYR